ncbi:hypothetical protein [Salinimicrobium soli]|uniref:hypothetical protein n=1 Tax=Salinimicrobium soli TaxID=1254399 RepID=UPI003AAD9CAA
MKNPPLLPLNTEKKDLIKIIPQDIEPPGASKETENESAPNPVNFSYRVDDQVEMAGHIFEEIRRFIDEEVQKRPSIHPFLDMRTFEDQKFHHIKDLLNEVHLENVLKGKATPKEVLDKELEEFLAPFYERGELKRP